MRKLVFIILIIFSGVIGFAQKGILNEEVVNYNNPKKYVLGTITFSGKHSYDENTLRLFTGLTEGDQILIPGDRITKAIKNLWDQKLFADVKITMTKVIGNTVFLDIYLDERSRLGNFSFRGGVSKSEADKMREELQFIRGMIITENLKRTFKKTVTDYYIEKGFRKIKVSISERTDTTMNNGKTLIAKIKKGNRIKVGKISFTGNESIADGKLRRSMKNTKERHWYRLFSSSKFIPHLYREDKNSIIEKYNENGFRDAKVVADTIYDQDEKNLKINIIVDEGNKYYFRDITWVGNVKYRTGQLDSILGIEKGEVYNQKTLDSKLFMNQNGRDISSLYMDDGYLFFQVLPIEVGVENDSIDIEMRVYEGKQATINRIIIKGNTKTNDHVVLREIRTKPGDLFNRNSIIRTQRELAQLGYFDPETLGVNPIPSQEDGTVDIEYTVTERPSDQIELSGGWGGGRVVGTLGISFTNFSMRKFFKKDAWTPLPSGDGQKLSIRAQSNGAFFRSYNFSFTEPWLGGKKPISLSVSAFQSLQSNGLPRGNDGRRFIKITGGSVGIGKRLRWPDNYFVFSGNISYQHYELNQFNSVFSFADGYSNNLSIQGILSRNSVDQPIFPRMGSSVTLSLKITPPFSSFDGIEDYSQLSDQEKFKWIEYHKWKFTSSWFTTIAGNLVLNTRAGFGYLGSFNKSLGDSPFERFYLGGSGLTGFALDGREIIALRGYDDLSISPNIGSTFISKYTLELRYPLSLNPSATVYGLAFTEAGNTWNSFKDYNPFQVKRSAGVGMRIFLPMFGLLGLDYGWGFDSLEQSPAHVPSSGRFHFTIGMNLGEL